MANTSAVYARIDTDLKTNAENILSQLGISPSAAIQMLYSQIVLTRGFPFKPQLPSETPAAAGSLTREQLSSELIKGLIALRSGKTYTADEVDEILSAELGI